MDKTNCAPVQRSLKCARTLKRCNLALPMSCCQSYPLFQWEYFRCSGSHISDVLRSRDSCLLQRLRDMGTHNAILDNSSPWFPTLFVFFRQTCLKTPSRYCMDLVGKGKDGCHRPGKSVGGWRHDLPSYFMQDNYSADTAVATLTSTMFYSFHVARHFGHQSVGS